MQEKNIPRKLDIDLVELDFALDNSSDETSYYLNLETGEVIPVTQEIQDLLQEIIYKVLENRADGEKFDLDSFLKTLDLKDWQKQVVREVHEIQEGLGITFIAIPRRDSYQGYREIKDFVETVNNPQLKERLKQALNGDHPFRRFDDVLKTDSEEKELWFQFQRRSLRERSLKWLADEGIEIESPQGKK